MITIGIGIALTHGVAVFGPDRRLLGDPWGCRRSWSAG